MSLPLFTVIYRYLPLIRYLASPCPAGLSATASHSFSDGGSRGGGSPTGTAPLDKQEDLNASAAAKALADRKAGRHDAKRMFSTPHSALPTSPGPFPLQNVKEQARGRRTDSTLPRYHGNTSNKC